MGHDLKEKRTRFKEMVECLEQDLTTRNGIFYALGKAGSSVDSRF
jgi:hypothetical protein